MLLLLFIIIIIIIIISIIIISIIYYFFIIIIIIIYGVVLLLSSQQQTPMYNIQYNTLSNSHTKSDTILQQQDTISSILHRFFLFTSYKSHYFRLPINNRNNNKKNPKKNLMTSSYIMKFIIITTIIVFFFRSISSCCREVQHFATQHWFNVPLLYSFLKLQSNIAKKKLLHRSRVKLYYTHS